MDIEQTTTEEQTQAPATPTPTRKERARQLRETLRNGRNSQARRDGQDFGANDRGVSSASGAAFQTTERSIGAATVRRRGNADSNRGAEDNGRGMEGSGIGSGSGDRRYQQSNSSSVDDQERSDEARSVGRVVAAERINPNKPNAFFNEDVRSDQTSKLSTKYPESNTILSEHPDITVRQLADRLGVAVATAHNIKKEYEAAHPAPVKKEPINLTAKLPGGGLVLSEKEVNEIQEDFSAALESDFEALDKYLVGRQKLIQTPEDELVEEIWSNLSEKELATLTKFMLKTGRRNPAMATIVRGVVESSDYIAVGTILLPRLKASGTIIRKTYQPPKKRMER